MLSANFRLVQYANESMIEPFLPYNEAAETNYRRLKRLNLWAVGVGLLTATMCFAYVRYLAESDQQILLGTTVLLASLGLVLVATIGMLGGMAERWARRKLTERRKK